jgi:Rha family phage regulatory protein
LDIEKYELVVLVNGKSKTDSLKVSEKFKKRHADILRSVENLECSIEFNERNFSLVNYVDVKGETRPKIDMTFDGFTFLVMGFTGKKAARFKEDYINAFNELEEKYLKALEEKERLYSQLFDTTGLLSMNHVVKTFGKGIGRNKTMYDMRKKKILLKNSNLPAQSYIDNGYFAVKDVIKTNRYKTRIFPTTFVTPKGIDFLAKMYA